MSSRGKARPTLSSLNVRSSVLCPETSNITSQYLALEQLEAHHRMVSKAKNAVDTSAPKSLQSYISNLNKRKKQLWNRDDVAFSPSRERPDSNLQRSADFTRDDEYHPDGDAVSGSISMNKSIQAEFPLSSYDSKVADKITWYLEAVAQGEFQTLASKDRRRFGMTGSNTSLSSSLRSGKVIKGDLLDWHKKCFTPENRPFSPRILAKNPAQSKLLGMRCYNHPRKQRKSGSLNSSDTFESDDDDDDDEAELEGESVSNNSANNEEEEEEENNNSEVIEEEDVVSHADQFEDGVSSFQENSSSKYKSSENSKSRLGLRNSLPRNKQKLIKMADSRLFSRSHISRKLSQLSSSNPFSLLSCDEEEKYLKFLNDVTEDILRSGVYTDKAIQRTFEFHLQFYSKNSESDERKLRKLLTQVLEGLKLGGGDDDDELGKPIDSLDFARDKDNAFFSAATSAKRNVGSSSPDVPSVEPSYHGTLDEDDDGADGGLDPDIDGLDFEKESLNSYGDEEENS